MWTPEKKYCLACVKSFLSGIPVPAYDPCMDPEKIRQCAQENGVAAILYSVIRKYQIEIPNSLAEWLKDRYIESAGVHLLLESELAAMGAAAGSSHVALIKGAAFAKDLYGDAALRPIADVDAVMDPEQEPQFVALLKQFSYERVEQNLHLYQKGSLRFDLHCDLFNTERIRSRQYLFAEFPRLAMEKNVATPGFCTLSAPQHFAYLLFHNVKHSFTKWIWLVDTVLFAKKYFGGLNWAKLSGVVRPFGAQKLLAYNLDIISGLWDVGESSGQKGLAGRILGFAKNDEKRADAGPVLLGLMIRSRLNRLRYFMELVFPRREVLGEMFARPGVRVGHPYYLMRLIKLFFRAIRFGIPFAFGSHCGKKEMRD